MLNTGLEWTKVWECEYESLAGLNYPSKTISLNLDGYHEFRVICYVNGIGSNITTTPAVISPRADGNGATATIMMCSEGDNGGVILEGRLFSYSKSAHTLYIRDGWRWTSPNKYSIWHGQIKPAYIEAR